jgi:hypothetical protein
LRGAWGLLPANCGDNGDVAVGEVLGQRRQLFEARIRPTVFDHYVAAFGVAVSVPQVRN